MLSNIWLNISSFRCAIHCCRLPENDAWFEFCTKYWLLLSPIAFCSAFCTRYWLLLWDDRTIVAVVVVVMTIIAITSIMIMFAIVAVVVVVATNAFLITILNYYLLYVITDCNLWGRLHCRNIVFWTIWHFFWSISYVSYFIRWYSSRNNYGCWKNGN